MGFLTSSTPVWDRAQKEFRKWSVRTEKAFAKIGSRWNKPDDIPLGVSSRRSFLPEKDSPQIGGTPYTDYHVLRTKPFPKPVFTGPGESMSSEKDSAELKATFKVLAQQRAAHCVPTKHPRPMFLMPNGEVFMDYRTTNTEYWRLQETLLFWHLRAGMSIGLEAHTFPRSDLPADYWTKQCARRSWHFNQYWSILFEKRRMDAEMACLEIWNPREVLNTMLQESDISADDAGPETEPEPAPAYSCVHDLLSSPVLERVL